MGTRLYRSAGGNAQFIAEFVSGSIDIAAGASGTLVTITPVAGKRIVLSSLSNAVTSMVETGISVNVGTKNVIVGLGLDNQSSGSVLDGDFVIGDNFLSATSTINQIVGEIGEAVELIKDTGSTVNAIRYSYAEGV